MHENLPRHIELTHQEPGCIAFEVHATDNPLVWQVNERFENSEAFALHQARVQASQWGCATAGIQRHYVIQEVDADDAPSER